jgi:filamentous hemagglutinin family protein
MKKIFVLFMVVLLGIFLFIGCDGTTIPNEGEGEGEGESEVQQVVLVEAIVAKGCSYCSVVEPYLEQLADEYTRDEMILVELIPWNMYSIPEAYQRYQWYSFSTGTPQIMFNGLTSALLGSQTYSAIKLRIEGQLNLTPKISIQANRTSSGDSSIISGTIKNIGETTLSNIEINGMTFRSRGDFPYAVTDIFEDEKIEISSLAAGESKAFTMTLEDINWDDQKLDGVIFVQETTGKKIIRQSLFID